MIKARNAIFIIYLCLLPAFAAAQDEPRFLIERIDVRNAQRVSPDIVVAESRLHTGRSYTEGELAEASDRLTRLPFLLDAQFALEKGSVRDSHVLVITINETKSFFFLLDLMQYYDSSRPGSEIRVESDQGAVVGMRFFVGRKGAFHFGLDNKELGLDRPFSENPNFAQVGYTQYDILGSRAFATLNLRYVMPVAENHRGRVRPEVVVGVPLTPRQTLTASYDSFAYSFDRRNGDHVRAEQTVSLRWAYDTTNDPFFPTDGTRFSVTPLMAWSDLVRGGTTVIGDPVAGGPVSRPPTPAHRDTRAIEAGAAKYWSISDRNSIGLSGEAGLADIELRSVVETVHDDVFYGTANLGFSHSFWDASSRAANAGDNRIEMNLRLTRDTEDDLERGVETTARVNTAWVRRSAWGTVRIGLGYAW